MTDRRGPGTKKPRLEAESIVYWRTQAARHRAEVERLTNHIRNTGIDDLEACLSVADGKCARLEGDVARLLAVARRWLRVMGDAGSDRCGCRPDESYVCCRCEVVAAIAKAEGKS